MRYWRFIINFAGAAHTTEAHFDTAKDAHAHALARHER